MTDRNNNLDQRPNHSILAWKSQTIPNAFILKQQGKRYLGLLRQDRHGQEYWKYRLLKAKETPTLTSEQVACPSSPVEKFQARQTKTEQLNNHGKSNNSNEQSINEQSH